MNMICPIIAIISLVLPLAGNAPAVPVKDESISTLQAWFGAHYEPDFEYGPGWDFVIEDKNRFSPYHIIPQWDQATCSVSKKFLRSSVKEWTIPVLAERLIQISYGLKDGEPAVHCEGDAKQELVIRETGLQKMAVIRITGKGNPEKDAEGLFEVFVNMDTGLSEMVSYSKQGMVRFYYDYSAQFGSQLYPLDMMNEVGGHKYDYLDRLDHRTIILRVSPSVAYENMKKLKAYHRKTKQKLSDDDYRLRWRVDGRRNPAFPMP